MLGYRSLAELEEHMSSAELTLWMAFEAAYGLPDIFTLAGVLPSAVNRGFTGGDVSPASVLPYFDQPRPPQDPEETKLRARAVFAQISNKSHAARPT